jgi:hypothetical protein
MKETKYPIRYNHRLRADFIQPAMNKMIRRGKPRVTRTSAAWPLRKDDTQNREAFHILFFVPISDVFTQDTNLNLFIRASYNNECVYKIRETDGREYVKACLYTCL